VTEIFPLDQLADLIQRLNRAVDIIDRNLLYPKGSHPLGWAELRQVTAELTALAGIDVRLGTRDERISSMLAAFQAREVLRTLNREQLAPSVVHCPTADALSEPPIGHVLRDAEPTSHDEQHGEHDEAHADETGDAHVGDHTTTLKETRS